MQKVIAQFNIPGMSSKQYDQVMKELHETGFENPKGRLQHVASEAPSGGWMVVDIWDSGESMEKFAETLVPLLIKAGITPPQPTVFPIYNYETV